MKRALLIIATLVFLLSPQIVEARTSYRAPRIKTPAVVPIAPVQRVNGYTTKKGKVVKPFYRTVPDNRKYNNFSTKGNLNPFTGKRGTK